MAHSGYSFSTKLSKKIFFHRTIFEKTCPDSFSTILTYYMLVLQHDMSAAWPSGLRRYFGNHSTRSSRFDSRPCHNLKKFFCYSSSCNEYFGNIYLHYSTSHYQLWFIYLKYTPSVFKYPHHLQSAGYDVM